MQCIQKITILIFKVCNLYFLLLLFLYDFTSHFFAIRNLNSTNNTFDKFNLVFKLYNNYEVPLIIFTTFFIE